MHSWTKKCAFEKVYSNASAIQSTGGSFGLMAAKAQPSKSSIDVSNFFSMFHSARGEVTHVVSGQAERLAQALGKRKINTQNFSFASMAALQSASMQF